MSEQKVAGRYAKSLLDLSKAQNNTDAVLEDMQDFLGTLKQNPQIDIMLKSPVVTNDNKIAVLRKIFGKAFQKTTIDFFDLVVRKNRSYFMGVIANVFIDQYNEMNNIMKASVKTAQALDEKATAEVRKFIEQYTGKKVQLQSIVDPSLIGGLEIQMGDRLFNASIAGKLSKIKHELLNTYISK